MNETSNGNSDRDRTASVLRQFAVRRSATERCELCSADLAPLHSHLLKPENREILCACEPCALLFCGQAGATLSTHSATHLSAKQFPDDRHGMGSLDDSHQPGLLLPRQCFVQNHRNVSKPCRSDRVTPHPRIMGRDTRTKSFAANYGAGCGSSAGEPRERRSRILHRPDR